MGALIKSASVELDTLLLSPGVVRAVSEHKHEAQTDSTRALAQKPVTSSAVPSAQKTGPILNESKPEVDLVALEEAVYQRLMDEHEARLESLCAQAREEAYAAGYAEGERSGLAVGMERGMEQGVEQGRAAYAEAVSALEQIAHAGRDALVAELDQLEPVIAEIVFQVVCKIVGDALCTPEGTLAVVKAVLANTKRSEIVGLKLSPRDLTLLLEHAQEIGLEAERLQAFGLEADESIELGGCIVQLKGGHIDGRIETQFRAFAQSLKDAAQGRS